MKKVEEDYRSLLVQYKEAKCEIEKLNGELSEAFTKVKFLELKVVQANVKMERVSSKKLDDVLSSQNISLIEPGWDIPEKVVQMSKSLRK